MVQVDKEKLKDGYKADEGKARHDLVPAICIEELAKHYTAGANKYEDNNWMKGMRWGQVYAALCRHLFAFWSGEDYDEETGNLHMVAVMWGATTLLYYQKYPERFKGLDDRPWKGMPVGVYKEGQIVRSGEIKLKNWIASPNKASELFEAIAAPRTSVPFENQSGPNSHHYGQFGDEADAADPKVMGEIIDRLDWGHDPAAKHVAKFKYGVPPYDPSEPIKHGTAVPVEEENILELNLPHRVTEPRQSDWDNLKSQLGMPEEPVPLIETTPKLSIDIQREVGRRVSREFDAYEQNIKDSLGAKLEAVGVSKATWERVYTEVRNEQRRTHKATSGGRVDVPGEGQGTKGDA